MLCICDLEAKTIFKVIDSYEVQFNIRDQSEKYLRVGTSLFYGKVSVSRVHSLSEPVMSVEYRERIYYAYYYMLCYAQIDG